MIISTLSDTILKSWDIKITNVTVQHYPDSSWIPAVEDAKKRLTGLKGN